MSTSTPDTSATAIAVTEDDIQVTFGDGRIIRLPFTAVPRLADARPSARANWRAVGPNEGIHWPELDEDLSVAGIIRAAALL